MKNSKRGRKGGKKKGRKETKKQEGDITDAVTSVSFHPKIREGTGKMLKFLQLKAYMFEIKERTVLT